MDSVDSLWHIIESNSITVDLSPEESQTGIVESLPISLDTFGVSSDQEIVQQSSAGVKRSNDENLNSSYIQQSKVVILPEGSEQQPMPVVMVTFNIPKPTATNSHPRLENDPGLHGFSVRFSQMEERVKKKGWEFSELLNKLYVVMDCWVLVEFRAPAGFYIRALPVYSLPNDLTRPVKRCPSHAALQDKTNKDFPFPDHLIRVEGEDPNYQEDFTSGRLSVIFPVLGMEAGSQLESRLLKFMCFGSDTGGINRRPVKLVFTLEDELGMVVGRQVVDLRLCSSPKRDKQKDEEKHQQEETVRNITHSVGTSASVFNSDPAPGGLKPVNVSGGKYLMIPVRREDYKSVDQLAEQLDQGRQILDNPEKPHAEVIQGVKEERIKLMIEHNPDIVHLLAISKKKN